MKLLMTLGLLAMLALGAAACGTDDQPGPGTARTTSTSVALPSDPKTRMAIRPNDDGSVSVFAQWFSSGQGAGSWNRVVLSRVSAEQLADGTCVNTQGREVGDGTALVRGVVCPVLREGERRIEMYIQARRPTNTWSERQLLGEIGEEKQQEVGTTFFTSKFSYPVRAADFEPPERTSRRSAAAAAAIPDFPAVRVAAKISDAGDLALALDWRGNRENDWHRIQVGKVSANRLSAGNCFSAPRNGQTVGRQLVRVKVVACIRDSSKIELYLQGGRPTSKYKAKKFAGGIPPELQAASVGKWIRADANLTAYTLVGAEPVRNTRSSPVRTSSGADCSRLHSRAIEADQRAVTPAGGASERRAADAAWATHDRNCR